jgi:hypothetical protein
LVSQAWTDPGSPADISELLLSSRARLADWLNKRTEISNSGIEAGQAATMLFGLVFGPRHQLRQNILNEANSLAIDKYLRDSVGMFVRGLETR